MGSPDGPRPRFGKAEVADLARGDQAGRRAHGILDRHVRIDAFCHLTQWTWTPSSGYTGSGRKSTTSGSAMPRDAATVADRPFGGESIILVLSLMMFCWDK